MPDSHLILAGVTARAQYVKNLARAGLGIMLLGFVIFVSYVSGRFMYYTLIFTTSPMELPPGATGWIVGCSLVWVLASSVWLPIVWKNFASLTLSPQFLWGGILVHLMMHLPFLLLLPCVFLPSVIFMGTPSSVVLLLLAGVAYLMLGGLMWRLDRSGWPVKVCAVVQKKIRGATQSLYQKTASAIHRQPDEE